MKCPILVADDTYNGPREDYTRTNCLQEKCGQWDDTTGLCARVAEVRVLTAIGNVLGRIADNLPKDQGSR